MIEDKPLRLSWSRIRDWEECHQRAHLHMSGKTSPVRDIRNFFPGTVVDRCMRNWLDTDGRPEAGAMLAMVDEILDTEEVTAKESGDGIVRWRNPGDKIQVRKWCKELVSKLEPILYEEAVPFDYQPAMRFKTPISIPDLSGNQRKIVLVGEIDLLVKQRADPNHWVVWDLKGTNDNNYWRKVVGQLLFYEIAINGLFGDWPVKSGLIQPMCAEPRLSFIFTEEHRMEMFSRIVRVASEMWAGDTSPKAGTAGCDRCDVRHACIRFKGTSGGRVPGTSLVG